MPSYLIVGISVVPFALFLLFINRKKLKLSIIRFFYGSYSYTYIESFQKAYYMETPYPSCIPGDLVHYFSNFINLDTGKDMYSAKTTIAFGTVLFNTKFLPSKEYAKPDYFNIYKLSDKYTLKIMGYKKEIMGSKIREVYLLVNGIFFMGEYIFSDVSKSNSEKLIEMLTSKYKINEAVDSDAFYIRDHKDSLIYFENNGFSVSIQYINFREPFINEVWNTYLTKQRYKNPFSTNEGDSEVFSKL